MKRLIISWLALISINAATVPALAQNLFSPLNNVRDVNNADGFGAVREGTGQLDTNLLHSIFNPQSGHQDRVQQVPLQMLDGTQSILQLRARDEDNVDGIRILSGQVDGAAHNMATLINTDGQLRGRIWKDGQLFRLSGNQSGEYKLSEIKRAILPEGIDTIAQDNSGDRSNQRAAPLPSADEPIDLLLLITTRAVEKLGGVVKAMAEMKLLIAETNNIYRRSGVTDGLMFRTVGILQMPYTGQDNLRRDITFLRSSKIVLSTRNKLGADLVSVIVTSNDSNTCGIGFIGPDLNEPQVYPELGYSISKVGCVLRNLVFAHELGHNMGARHDRAADPNKGDNHGHINLEKKWRTVMAYNKRCLVELNEDCPEIPYFSNPDLTYKGDPAGVIAGETNSANNVERIRLNKRIVASYRPRADGGGASISGATNVRPRPGKIGGIILESAVQGDGMKAKGKERKIKW